MLQNDAVAFSAMQTPFPPSLVFQDAEAHLLAMEDFADPENGEPDAWQCYLAMSLGQPMMASRAG